ncbi:hypothetical protein N7668_23690 [Pseudomonas fulva]|uniref:hypothetical protein n=1 Tax=Pseudomonas fulva TaxID=47880 RepID=UPI00244D7623|nr:hypothetical protein [Pseudomonas fulva]MDH0574238.1 hypothetical protein [Pseudomonas fulva]
MNNNDYKALLISIVAGLAVNIAWALMTHETPPVSLDPGPRLQWVLQRPPGPLPALWAPRAGGGQC